jgi:hypothetical protein
MSFSNVAPTYRGLPMISSTSTFSASGASMSPHAPSLTRMKSNDPTLLVVPSLK